MCSNGLLNGNTKTEEISSDWSSGQSRGQFDHPRPQSTLSSLNVGMGSVDVLNGENQTSFYVSKFPAYLHNLRCRAVVKTGRYSTEDTKFNPDFGRWTFDQSTEVSLFFPSERPDGSRRVIRFFRHINPNVITLTWTWVLSLRLWVEFYII